MLDGIFHGLTKASLPNGSSYDSLISSLLNLGWSNWAFFGSTKRTKHAVFQAKPGGFEEQKSVNPLGGLPQESLDPDFFLCSLMAGMAIKSACPSSAAARDGLCLQIAWCQYIMPCHAENCERVSSYAFIEFLPCHFLSSASVLFAHLNSNM